MRRTLSKLHQFFCARSRTVYALLLQLMLLLRMRFGARHVVRTERKTHGRTTASGTRRVYGQQYRYMETGSMQFASVQLGWTDGLMVLPCTACCGIAAHVITDCATRATESAGDSTRLVSQLRITLMAASGWLKQDPCYAAN